MMVSNKCPNQARTLKLHMNLCNNHHRDRVTTLQRLRSTILPPKLFLKTNLVILKSAITTYSLVLPLITQRIKDIDVCKNSFNPLFVCHSHSPFLPFSHTHQSTFLLVYFGDKFLKRLHFNRGHSTLTNKVYKKSSTQNSKRICIRIFTLR